MLESMAIVHLANHEHLDWYKVVTFLQLLPGNNNKENLIANQMASHEAKS